jgi:L-fuculose-phosphate aldolase
MYARFPKSPPEQLAEVMTRIYDLHLTTPSGGNISMLDDDGVLWVTPSQLDKGKLGPEDMIRIFPDGTFKGPHKPTMEYRFHLEIYRSRPDIRAIAHAHPPGLVAFSMVRNKFTFDHIPSLLNNIHLVGLCSYALPGSSLLGQNIRTAFEGGCHAAFMENHGIITTGQNLQEAFYRIESMEALASVYIDSLRTGEISNLSEEDRKLMKEYRNDIIPDLQGHHVTKHEQEIRNDLVEIVKRAYERKLVTSVSGGFSVRIDERGFVTIPEGVDARYLVPDDLVYISGKKHETGKTPSQFTALHDEIFRKHGFVRSVSSAHPVSVMAFALTGTEIDTRTIPESFIMLNRIPLVPFRQRFQNTEEIAGLITPGIPALLVRNDCITVTGTSPFQVFDRLEVAEFTARSILNAKPVGPVKLLGDRDIDDLAKAFVL